MSTAPLPERAPAREETRAAINAIYSWNYDSEIDQIRTLYANALERQWIAVRELDWEAGIDQEAFVENVSVAGFPLSITRFWQELPAEVRWNIARRTSAFLLSNFLHGEQGAMMVAAQMVNAVPHMDGKFYAATQTMDEARHVEVFAAYIELLDEVQPISSSLKHVLDATIGSESWLHKAVGMQVVVEGLALFTFRDMRNATREPLLKQLLTYVSRDEARHTGYGIKYLSHVVGTLDDAQRAELEDFGFEAARRLIDTRAGGTLRESLFQVWKDSGIDPADVIAGIADEREKMAAEVARSGGAFGPIRGFVIPTMRSVGLFSERIEGHFRELFAHNLGEERARAMEFDRGVPEDLEAWVMEGTAA